MKKIAFFDIDGTLTSEIDGSIPEPMPKTSATFSKTSPTTFPSASSAAV